MTYREAFDQLLMKLARIGTAYDEGNNDCLVDMAENGQFLRDNLEELVRCAEKWKLED